MAFDISGHGLLTERALGLPAALLQLHTDLAADLLGLTELEDALAASGRASLVARAHRALALQVNLQVATAPEASLYKAHTVGDIRVEYVDRRGAAAVDAAAAHLAEQVRLGLTPASETGTPPGGFDVMDSRR